MFPTSKPKLLVRRKLTLSLLILVTLLPSLLGSIGSVDGHAEVIGVDNEPLLSRTNMNLGGFRHAEGGICDESGGL